MRRFTWLIATLGWALACGGRAQFTVGENDAAGGVFAGQGGSVPSNGGAAARAGMGGKSAAGHGGSGNAAGAGSVNGGSGNAAGAGSVNGGSGNAAGAGSVNGGGTSTIGGASSVGGAIGTAGTVSFGGSCACDPIECAPGYVRVANGNDCCDHCESIACAQQLAIYLAYRQPVFDKYASIGCTLDTDCGFYYDGNACGGKTCAIPLSQSVIGEVSAVLGSYSQKNCDSSCPPEPAPRCDDPPHAVCLDGRCQ